MKKLKQELMDRGLLYQHSSDALFEIFDAGKGAFYCGFDPTASSLHLGNFIGFMVGVHLMKRGNTYIALTGGATGMIGDPGGKDAERTFLSLEELENNEKAVGAQISSLLKNLKQFAHCEFKFDFVNNKDFYKDMGYLDFLREVGKYMTVNVMMSKDTVKKRIEDPTKSISYTEFSYMLLQGYDFCRLFKDRGVKLQIGGQDQWGNLVTGTELIRKKYDEETYVLTWPLIVDSTGKKFGKSEGNALFLDKEKTSSYALYQYFMNTPDTDVARYLKMLTLIETEEIDALVASHLENPAERRGQQLLAFSVVEIIHSTADAHTAEKISQLLFGKEDKCEILKNLNTQEIQDVGRELGGFCFAGENLFESIVKAGLADSNSQAREAVKSGAIFIQERQIEDFNYNLGDDFFENGILLMRKGKKNFRIIYK